MKKEDIDRILKEADSTLRNYTDAQHKGQLTINKNRTKESCSKGGKVGGPKAGKIAKENKLGFHSMKKEDRVKLSKEIGNIIGPRSKEEGFGIFGLSKKETIKNAIAGGKASVKSKKHPNNVKVKCEHCGLKTSLPLYKRWHGDNCKHK
jgi:hypothetical protein